MIFFNVLLFSKEFNKPMRLQGSRMYLVLTTTSLINSIYQSTFLIVFAWFCLEHKSNYPVVLMESAHSAYLGWNRPTRSSCAHSALAQDPVFLSQMSSS